MDIDYGIHNLAEAREHTFGMYGELERALTRPGDARESAWRYFLVLVTIGQPRAAQKLWNGVANGCDGLMPFVDSAQALLHFDTVGHVAEFLEDAMSESNKRYYLRELQLHPPIVLTPPPPPTDDELMRKHLNVSDLQIGGGAEEDYAGEQKL